MTAARCDACVRMSEADPHPRRDRDGCRVASGDRVRIVGAPALAGMSPSARAESKPVFEHLVGTYRHISGFNEVGEAEVRFRIQRGRDRGTHTVWIEPCLLRKWSPRG